MRGEFRKTVENPILSKLNFQNISVDKSRAGVSTLPLFRVIFCGTEYNGATVAAAILIEFQNVVYNQLKITKYRAVRCARTTRAAINKVKYYYYTVRNMFGLVNLVALMVCPTVPRRRYPTGWWWWWW